MSTDVVNGGSNPLEAYRRHLNPYRLEQFEALEWTEDFVEARGCHLRDSRGRKYLDMVAGFGAMSLGHHHPAVVEALTRALASGVPCTLPAGIPRLAGRLAEELCELAGAGLRKVYFGNSGAEGIEAAMKFALAHTGRRAFVSFEGGYHGLTLGALSLVGGGNWKAPFPHVPELARVVPFGDVAEVERQLAAGDVAAVVTEVVQGVGGGRAWTTEGLVRLAALCREAGALLILDEVLTGMGRTGRWFAFQEMGEAVRPDIVVTSKGLTGGAIPMCAVLMTDAVFHSVYGSPGGVNIHSSTFSNNALAMTAGLSVLRAIREEGLMERAARVAERLRQGLERLQADGLGVLGIRGRGLLLTVHIAGLDAPEDSLGALACCQRLRELGVLVALAPHAPAWLKLTPPLTLTEAEADLFLERLRQTLEELAEARAQPAA